MRYQSRLELRWALLANYLLLEWGAKHDFGHPQIPSLRKRSNVKRSLMTDSDYKRLFVRECFLCGQCHFKKSLSQKETSRYRFNGDEIILVILLKTRTKILVVNILC